MIRERIKKAHLSSIRGRQGAQAMLKIKNNMLTAVLVVTTLPPSVPVSLELVEQICYTVGRAAAEMNEVRQPSSNARHPTNLCFQAHRRRNSVL